MAPRMGVRRSLAWSMLGHYGVMTLIFLSSVILSRLLTPAEIGVYSVAYSVMVVAQALREFGTSSYLVQEKDLTEDRLRSASGVTLVMGWGLALFFLLLSVPLAHWYGQPALGTMIRILSIDYFLLPVGAPLMALLVREMRFDVSSRISVIGSVVQMGVSVGLVLLGWSYYGLAWGAVAEAVSSVVLCTLYSPRRAWIWPGFRDWRRVAAFGWRAATTNILLTLNESSTDLVVGRFLGPAAAGFFSRANGLTNMLFTRVWGGAATVVMAEFSRRNHDGEPLEEGYTHAIALLTGIAWPVLAVLSISAGLVVSLLLGPQWNESVILVRILCFAAMIDTLSLPVSVTLLAAGHARLDLRAAVWTTGIRVGCLLAACAFGLSAVAVGAIFASLASVLISQAQLKAAIGLNLGPLLDACQRSLWVTAVTVILPSTVVFTMTGRVAPLILLVAIAAASAGGLLSGLWIFNHPLRKEVRRFLPFLK